MSKRLVVIGGNAAGLSAASKAKRVMPGLEVTVFEHTGFVSYGSCGLPYFVGDMIKKPEDLVSLTARQLTEKRGIATYLGHEVLAIDRTGKQVQVRDMQSGQVFSQGYDYLVVSTGATPIVPSLPGVDFAGVHVLRSVEDGISLKQKVKSGSRKAIIIGGGLIGLEVAEQLKLFGLEVDIVEALDRLIPTFEPTYGNELMDVLKRNGITVHLNSRAMRILGDDKVRGVELSDGSIVEGDLVLISIGVMPNSKLARECGLDLGYKGGIVVDERMRTSDPAIWACGDCVQMTHILSKKSCYIPMGTTANKQGRIAGSDIVGEQVSFKGVLGSQVTKVFDLYLAATGLSVAQAQEAGFDAVSSSIEKNDLASYYPGGGLNKITLVLDQVDGRLLGANGIGTASIAGRMNVLVAAITMGMTVEALNELDFVYSPSSAPVYDPLLIAASQAMKLVKGKSHG